jgi:competence ComEA-like helix-hairpin-helix protein
MNNYKYIILLFFIFSFYNIFAQTDSTYLKTEEVLEDILQEPAVEEDNSNLYDILEQLILNPIDINTAEIADLQQIPDIDFEKAKLIVNYRKKFGNFFSVDELNAVQGLDKELVTRIKPFVFVSKPKDSRQTDRKDESGVSQIFSNTNLLLRSRISNDLQTRKGFIENKFVGTKPRVYNRLLLKYDRNFQVGVLAEKDPGELEINEFTSYHFAIRDLGILKRFVAGDYLVEFGQGLAMWSPYAFSKGADAIYPVKRKDHLIRPYTSATEVSFLRGAAASLKINEFIVSGFYSKNKIDANIDTVTGDIISTPVDGFHRTQNEIRKKGAAEENLWGARVDYEHKGIFRTGFLYYESKFSNNFLPSKVFDLNGSKFNYTSFYYDLFINNINVFGEIVYNGTSVASINSFQFFIGRDFSFITSVRSYPRNFISIHGYAFGERSGATTNEFGIYTGIRWRTSFALINFYYDQFKFPFATFANPQPSNGDEFLADIISKPISRLETRIRYKYENKDVNAVISNTKQLVKRLRQLIRFELIYSPSKSIRLRGRFEYNNYLVAELDAEENGYLFFQDIRFSPTHNINLYARIIFFRTDSFNSAIYEYENDLTGVLTNRALFGEGLRWYLILRYRPMRLFTLSLKYSETYKPREKNISSGFNEIIGNLDNRLALQIDVKF